MRYAVALLLCCACGCLDRNIPEPGPGPAPDDEIVIPVDGGGTIDGFTAKLNESLRAKYLESAAKLESGQWKTVEQMLAGETDLMDAAFDEAAQPLANREQAETGNNWTPQKAAAYRRKIAEERQ